MSGTVALIGMGLLGSALAENLIKAGFTVRGYDTAPHRMREHGERGGHVAASSADAARGASAVMTCLMTADIVREALLGPAGAPLLATALHRQLLIAGVAAGLSERDNSSIVAVLRSLVE